MFNKNSNNDYVELEKLRKRSEVNKQKLDSFVNYANSFDQKQSQKGNNEINDLPTNKHVEYTDVVKKTDSNGIEATQIFDTIIDEQIFQSETGVIKRKFYKRVIKSSPSKSPNSNVIPSSTYIDNLSPRKISPNKISPSKISPGGRSFTVETTPKKKVSNLVSYLNDFRLPSSPNSPKNLSPVNEIDTPSKHSTVIGIDTPSKLIDDDSNQT